MNTQDQNISFQVYEKGTASAYYHFWEIEDEDVKKITEIVYHELCSAMLANSSIFDTSLIKTPKCQFQISKNGIFFHLDFYVIGPNVYNNMLELARNLQLHLNKKNYPSKIAYYNNNTNEKIFEYSNRTYWSFFLRNIAYINLFVIIFLIAGLYLSDLILHLLDKYIENKTFLSLIQDNLVSPLIGYPTSVVAFKLSPMIWKSRLITEIVILLTVYGYNVFTSHGYMGALILLGLFILQQIRDLLSE